MKRTEGNKDDIILVPERKKAHKGAHVLFMILVGTVFFALALVFLFFPRSKYSELEKRDLAEFPDVSLLRENPGDYTAAISHWFSDSEPFRDEFMTLSMYLRDKLKYKTGNKEEAISFIPAAVEPEASETPDTEENEPSAVQNPMAEGNAKIANAGIIVIGTGEDVRALMAYGGTASSGAPFVRALNKYAETFPNLNVYGMPIPTATEFYLPEKAAKASKPQKPTVDYVTANAEGRAKVVDAYSMLAAHTDEDIYLRTDHHWAPLGAFYAAKAFANAAGVPFRDIDSYDRKVIHRYVGSMYGYSKDISVKNAPEDFVYYVPKGVNAETTFVSYVLDKDYKITSQRGPYKGQFFHQFKDGSANAYLTFMGGDTHTVRIKTGTPSSRRVLIIKDSYGNPLPSFLFYSFDEIHVVDFRYFTQNMQDYVRNNGITDIVLAFNMFNVCSNSAMNKIQKFLSQAPGIQKEKAADAEGSEQRDSARVETKAVTVPEASVGAETPQSAKEPATNNRQEIETEKVI